MLKNPCLFGPCLDELTEPRIAFFELLYEQVFVVARKNIRKQAGRSIGRLCSYLTELYYPSFFIAVKERVIPARITIMDDIMLRFRLGEAPQRPPRTY